MRSAYVLISDPQCAQASALPHLRRAWQAVAWLSRGEVPEDPGDDLGAWLSPEHAALVPERARDQTHELLRLILRHARAPEPWVDGEPSPKLPSVRVLERHLRVLRGVLDGLEQLQRGRSRARHAVRWGIRAAWALGGLTALLLVTLRPWQLQRDGRWRAAYYATAKFEGDPIVRRDADVNFKWKKTAPMDSLPPDNFSVR